MSVRFALGFALALAAAPAIAKTTPDPYVPTGAKAMDCIPLTSIRSTNVRDDRTIDFNRQMTSVRLKVLIEDDCGVYVFALLGFG